MINLLSIEGVEQAVETAAENPAINTTITETAENLSISFWDLFMGGGWLMWVLVALAAVMIFIFVERFLAIRKASQIDKHFMNRIRDYILEGNINSAVDLCRRTDSPIARMIEKGIERIGRPMSDIQTAIENVANVEVAKLESGLPWLASISGGAPMIGFLGTVVGMVQVFIDMSANQTGGIELAQLSAGMYVAMVTTVGGLIVGIPAYFAHNYLVARVEKMVFRMEATTIAFMDILNQPVQK
jgi:biopolymer transport protein ExbB